MDEAAPDVLACMAIDESLRARLHGAKPLERVNREIKRPTDAAGTFPTARP